MKILGELASTSSIPMGRLHQTLFSHTSTTRQDFELLFGALERAGVAQSAEASFKKGGETITFRRARITRSGRQCLDSEELPPLSVPQALFPESGSSTRTPKRSATLKPTPVLKRPTGADAPETVETFEALRAWRLTESRKRRMPAFRILKDSVLLSLARGRPCSKSDLLDVPGIGPKIVEKYGDGVLGVLTGS